MSSPLEVRSFRSVFALERRIYRIDTLRLNPSGIPLRGVGYAAGLVLAALVAGALPPTAWLDPIIPWYVRDLGVPLAGATLLGVLRVEGRPFHLAALALLGYAFQRHRLGALTPLPLWSARWQPPVVVWLPDGSDARFRPLRYRGPGAVLVDHPHVRAEWSARHHPDVTLHPLPGVRGRPAVLELGPGAVLEVRTH